MKIDNTHGAYRGTLLFFYRAKPPSGSVSPSAQSGWQMAPRRGQKTEKSKEVSMHDSRPSMHLSKEIQQQHAIKCK